MITVQQQWAKVDSGALCVLGNTALSVSTAKAYLLRCQVRLLSASQPNLVNLVLTFDADGGIYCIVLSGESAVPDTLVLRTLFQFFFVLSS